MFEFFKKFFKEDVEKSEEDLRKEQLFKKYNFNPDSQLYPINQDYTDIVKFLIENKSNIEFILLDSHYLILKFNNLYYGFWITNKWNSYLSTLIVGTNYNYVFGEGYRILDEKYSFDSVSCDPEIMFKFYETFEFPNSPEEIIKTKLKNFKTELLFGLDITNKE